MTMSTTRPLTDAEYKALLSAPRGRMRLRDRCLIVMLRRGGFRISELLSLRLDDVVKGGKIPDEIQVAKRHTKGKHHGYAVPLHREARDALEAWLRKAARMGWQTREAYVFQSLGPANRPITRTHAWRIIHKAAKRVRLSGCIGPHSLRKSFGEHVYILSGRDIRATQEALRHKSLDSTLRYLAVTRERVRDLILDEGPAPGPDAP
jgi:site-specific recombinase XerD